MDLCELTPEKTVIRGGKEYKIRNLDTDPKTEKEEHAEWIALLADKREKRQERREFNDKIVGEWAVALTGGADSQSDLVELGVDEVHGGSRFDDPIEPEYNPPKLHDHFETVTRARDHVAREIAERIKKEKAAPKK